MTQAEGYPPSTTFDNTPCCALHLLIIRQLSHIKRNFPFGIF